MAWDEHGPSCLGGLGANLIVQKRETLAFLDSLGERPI